VEPQGTITSRRARAVLALLALAFVTLPSAPATQAPRLERLAWEIRLTRDLTLTYVRRGADAVGVDPAGRWR
jgi:hypothetical protein